MCRTCGLSGNALVPSEPLYTELVSRRRQPPPFPHLARAEGPYVVWPFPGGRAEHESAELFLQASLQSKVVSVMKEKCSEAHERGSANSAAKERPFDLVWHPLVPPHSVELSPGAICSPHPLINFSVHREHGKIHNAQKAVEAFIWYSCLLLENFRFSTVLRRLGKITSLPAFCRKPQVSSAEFTSPILLATVCSHSSAVPFSSKLFSKTSSAKSVTPQERSTSSYGLRPINAANLFGDRSLPLVNRTLKNRTKLVRSVLITHEQTQLRKTLAFPSGANTSAKSCRPRVMKKNLSINLSQSWLNHVFSVFLSSEPKAFAMSKLSSTNEMLSCRQRAAGARCAVVLVGIHSNTTVILATFPPEKDHGATLSRNRTSHVPNDMTRNPLSRAVG